MDLLFLVAWFVIAAVFLAWIVHEWMAGETAAISVDRL